MYHILIVDEEEHLLWALERNLFPQRRDVKVHTALSGEEGLEILERESVDLLISDIKMPGDVDGFQLILRAKEMVPDARVMIITAFGTHRIQNFAERIGISHYIEKPFTVDELRTSILEVLDEKEGFQGVLSDLELTDIIQMLCLAKRTALLHLKHRDHRGRIVFDLGEVVHAEFDGLAGAEAVYEMLDLRQGDIFMQSDYVPTERTIDMGWQDMLLEGVRRADERRLHEATAKVGRGEDGKAKGEGTKRTLTPMGMAIGGTDLGDESSAGLLFSEAELEEMSMAGEAAVEEEFRSADRQVEDVEESESEALDAAGTGIFEAVEDEEELEDEASESLEEPRSLRERQGTSPGMAAVVNAATMITDESGEFELFAAPALNGRYLREEKVFSSVEQTALEEFVRECPGLRVTSLFTVEGGQAQEAITLTNLEDYDERAVSDRLAAVFSRAQRAVEALDSSDELEEVQLALEGEYILMRAIEGSGTIHLVIVDRQVSLGIALVLMRQLGRRLGQEQ